MRTLFIRARCDERDGVQQRDEADQQASVLGHLDKRKAVDLFAIRWLGERESKFPKNDDDMASNDLRTRRLTWSDDRSIISASGTLKCNGTDGGSEISEAGSSFTRARAESVCGCSY